MNKKKEKLIKKIIKDKNKGMKNVIPDQKETIKENEGNQEIIIGCNYTIGYATANEILTKEFLSLISMNKKELKKLIKQNKKISRKNKKNLQKVIKKYQEEKCLKFIYL